MGLNCKREGGCRFFTHREPCLASCNFSGEARTETIEPMRTVQLALLIAAKTALRDVDGSYARKVWCDLRDVIEGTAGVTSIQQRLSDDAQTRNGGATDEP